MKRDPDTTPQRILNSATDRFDAGLKMTQSRSMRTRQRGVREIEVAAAAGNAEAQVTLANWHLSGFIVPQNRKKAEGLYLKACRAGHAFGMFGLARCLLAKGARGQTRVRAIELLRIAHRRGIWSAAHFIGRAAEDEGDMARAKTWYFKALESGDDASGMRLANLYLGRLEVKYHVEATKVLQRVIERGLEHSFDAMTELAMCHLHGRGLPRSRVRGLRLLRKAAPYNVRAAELLNGMGQSPSALRLPRTFD